VPAAVELPFPGGFLAAAGAVKSGWSPVTVLAPSIDTVTDIGIDTTIEDGAAGEPAMDGVEEEKDPKLVEVGAATVECAISPEEIMLPAVVSGLWVVRADETEVDGVRVVEKVDGSVKSKRFAQLWGSST